MSPRTPIQVQRIKDERREEILQAARAVFVIKGFAATKMSNIAAAAGVSYGLVYHYFPTKDAVYTAIVEEAMQRSAMLTDEALAREGTPLDRIRWLIAHMLAGVQQFPTYPFIMAQAHTSGDVPAQARAAVERYGGETFHNLVQLIENGQNEGQIVAVDAAELARVILATIQGLSLGRNSDSAAAPSPNVETILRLLKP